MSGKIEARLAGNVCCPECGTIMSDVWLAGGREGVQCIVPGCPYEQGEYRVIGRPMVTLEAVEEPDLT